MQTKLWKANKKFWLPLLSVEIDNLSLINSVIKKLLHITQKYRLDGWITKFSVAYYPLDINSIKLCQPKWKWLVENSKYVSYFACAHFTCDMTA